MWFIVNVLMVKYAFFVLCIKAVFAQTTDEYRVVNITQGAVRGRMDPEEGVYAFYNIPYATAPTGRNKFKAPLDPPVWMHTFDAVNRAITCPQPLENFGNMQEDCLVANVFVPDTDDLHLSVVVYFHGGAFQYGFGNSERLNNLVRSKKVIVVTFNYRLGAHGFLCLGTKGAPGNAGLKDQVALLRWVRKNIASFGGNPEQVTLFGCSSGSGSIDVVTLSSVTSGLFNRAIMDSGVALGDGWVQIDPLAKAQSYAKMLNFDNVDDVNALEEFYTTASFQQLYSRPDAIIGNFTGNLVFGPCVERDVGEERILEEAPLDILKKGIHNRPIAPRLFGFVNMEGLFRMPVFELWKDRMNVNFADFLPGELYFESEEVRAEVAKSVKEFYFGDQPVGEDTILAYIDYFTDVLIAYPIMKSVRTRVEFSEEPVYLFEYSFVDYNSPNIPHTDEKGSNHCDQTRAIADSNQFNITPEYVQMKAIMREYWLNFILTGSPWQEGSELVRWPPINASGTPYLSLGTTIQLKDNLLKERVAFWDRIYDLYYQVPMPPRGSAVALMVSYFLLACAMFNFIL